MTASSITRGLWQALAAECMANAEGMISGVDPTLNKNAGTFAFMAHAVGEFYGWTDPRIQGWYDTACAARSASGGYGIGAALDGNPADTDYLITTTYMLGPHLAAGYDNGFVSNADFDILLDRVRNWPTYAYNWGISGQPGALPDYSSTPAGGTTAQHAEDRIWNVIAAAATFLLYNRYKTADGARAADCLAKGTAWKNAVVWAYNRPKNVGGWVYRGVPAATANVPRQDGTHNTPCSTMKPWLPGGAAALRTQMAAGVAPGDIVATTTGTAEGNYVGGALSLLAYHAEAHTPPSSPTGTPPYTDQLIGRVAADIDARAATASAGTWAELALRCILVHKIGLTL